MRLLLFVPLAIFIAIGTLFWIGLGIEDKTSLPSPLINQPFPAFATLSLERGEDITAALLTDNQPTLVNVWATWCPTCKAEHEFLNGLAAQGVRIIGINYKDDDYKARQWLLAYGNPYVWNIPDPDGRLGLELGVYGAPETFLLDANGIIRAKHIGDLNDRVWQRLGQHYEALKP